ncbi:MAG TPA: 7-cyano-7-deazaguanine synthase QueC [Pirellulaceae bacterium]
MPQVLPDRSNRRPPAIVLLSGGLDSATTLAVALADGYDAHTLSFRYGQRHGVELSMAQRLAERFQVASHRVIELDLRQFGGSALTAEIDVPQDRSPEAMSQGIPVTYVPARNTIFLSYALAYAEVLPAWDIFIGVNAVDYSGYPDCRPEYVAAFERLANLATRSGTEGNTPIRIHVPLIALSKREIIQKGSQLGVDYRLTSTCYAPDVTTSGACGRCDACQLRLRGFAEAGLHDPALYIDSGVPGSKNLEA